MAFLRGAFALPPLVPLVYQGARVQAAGMEKAGSGADSGG